MPKKIWKKKTFINLLTKCNGKRLIQAGSIDLAVKQD